MRWRWTVAVVVLTSAAAGQEVPDPDEASVVEPAVSAALGRALADRFVACAGAEGEALTEADRSTVADGVAPMAPAVARGLGAEECTTDPAAEAACIELVRSANCDALARGLQDAPSAMSPTAAPAWADGHARTLTARLSTCLAAERDGGTSNEELAALDGLRRALGATLGLLVSTGRCRVDENALPTCALSVGALSCDELSRHLEEDPGRLASGVTPECTLFLQCGDDDAGADEADASLEEPIENR